MECARIACKHFIQPNRIESMGSLLFKLKSNFGIKKCECEQSECNIVEHVYCVVRWAKWFIKHGRDGKHTAWIMQYRRILCSVQCDAMQCNWMQCKAKIWKQNNNHNSLEGQSANALQLNTDYWIAFQWNWQWIQSFRRKYVNKWQYVRAKNHNKIGKRTENAK